MSTSWYKIHAEAERISASEVDALGAATALARGETVFLGDLTELNRLARERGLSLVVGPSLEELWAPPVTMRRRQSRPMWRARALKTV